MKKYFFLLIFTINWSFINGLDLNEFIACKSSLFSKEDNKENPLFASGYWVDKQTHESTNFWQVAYDGPSEKKKIDTTKLSDYELNNFFNSRKEIMQIAEKAKNEGYLIPLGSIDKILGNNTINQIPELIKVGKLTKEDAIVFIPDTPLIRIIVASPEKQKMLAEFLDYTNNLDQSGKKSLEEVLDDMKGNKKWYLKFRDEEQKVMEAVIEQHKKAKQWDLDHPYFVRIEENKYVWIGGVSVIVGLLVNAALIAMESMSH